MAISKKIIVKIITAISKAIIAKYKPFIIAVTGSVGKTSTKDAIYSVLKNRNGFVRKSEKSMNSEIGLPLTIIGSANPWHNIGGWVSIISKGIGLVFGKHDYPDCLVLEVGADHPGDIKNLVKWLKPDIAIITKISPTPVHVEFFRSPDDVFAEKSALAKAVKSGGKVIIFADESKTSSLTNLIDKDREVITYGLKESAGMRGFDYEIYGMNQGISFKVNMDGRIETIRVTGIIGVQNVYPLLAATVVGKVRGVSTEDILRGLYDFVPPRGRMNVMAGANDVTIIDDTYNSSPDAVVAAITALKDAKCSGRRIAILGDMMELGKYSTDEHKKIGIEIAKVADMLVAVGPRSRTTGNVAIENGMPKENVFLFDNADQVVSRVASLVGVGDVILVKGSQSMRMERVVKALLKDSSMASKLLVRQEREWLEKV